jgi:hypothetical protein
MLISKSVLFSGEAWGEAAMLETISKAQSSSFNSLLCLITVFLSPLT